MKVRDVILAVDDLAPPALAYGWDKAGLSTGRLNADVSKVLVTLTITRDAFAEAQRLEAEMIVSHHPLIWEPLQALRADDPYIIIEGKAIVSMPRVVKQDVDVFLHKAKYG